MKKNCQNILIHDRLFIEADPDFLKMKGLRIHIFIPDGQTPGSPIPLSCLKFI
jgi:hypothetical protein